MSGQKVAHMQGARNLETGMYNSDFHTCRSFEIHLTVHEDSRFLQQRNIWMISRPNTVNPLFACVAALSYIARHHHLWQALYHEP